jgi:hypothetical protein
MAVIGDILVKLVADFAQFAQGMDESVKQLERLGTASAKANESVANSFKQIKSAIAGLGLYEIYNQINAAVDKVQESVLKIADAAHALGISTTEFQGLKEAARDSGIGVDQASAMFQRFQAQVSSAAHGNADAIKLFDQLGIQILDAGGKVRSSTELFQQFAVAIQKLPASQRGLIEDTLLGKSGAPVDKLLGDLRNGFDQAADGARKLGTFIDQDVSAKMEALRARSEIATEKMTAFFAPFVANIKTDVLEHIAEGLTSIQTALAATKPYESTLDKIIAYLSASRAPAASLEVDPATGLPKGVTDVAGAMSGSMDDLKTKEQALTDQWQADLEKVSKKNDELAAKAVEMNQTVADMVRQYGFADARVQDMIVSQRNLNAEIDKGVKKAGDLAAALINAAVGPPDTPPPVAPSDFGRAAWGKTTQAKPIVSGGGGGSTDQNNIEAQIKRYDALAVAADKAYQTILANENQDIETLKRKVTVQQQVDDIVAKLTARNIKATDEEKQRLYDSVDAAEQKRAAEQKLLEVEVAATETSKKYGDGTVALAKLHKDLAQQLATHRINQDELNRATKEGTEAIQQAALAAQRYDDNLGSLAAGFEHAALAYARQNDLFTLGEQAFSGLTTAMTEGLKVLEGQSNKTFGQIAADFANMLAQMALQAAVSQVFKTVFGAIAAPAAGGVAPGAVSPGDWAAMLNNVPGLPGRAAGGPVGAGQPYVVGEQGPELFVPAGAGRIVPSANANGGGVSVAIDMRGTTSSAGTTDPSAAQQFGRKVRAAVVDIIQNEQRPGGTLYQRGA